MNKSNRTFRHFASSTSVCGKLFRFMNCTFREIIHLKFVHAFIKCSTYGCLNSCVISLFAWSFFGNKFEVVRATIVKIIIYGKNLALQKPLQKKNCHITRNFNLSTQLDRVVLNKYHKNDISSFAKPTPLLYNVFTFFCCCCSY